jgi:hypothetical protein
MDIMNRRKFLYQAGLAGTMLGISPLLQASASPLKTLPSLKNKKILFVWGGWAGHEPDKCRDIFVPWLKSEGADVQVYDNLDCYTDKTLMGNIDLVVQTWTMGKISNEQAEGLLSAIKDNGVGIAG